MNRQKFLLTSFGVVQKAVDTRERNSFWKQHSLVWQNNNSLYSLFGVFLTDIPELKRKLPTAVIYPFRRHALTISSALSTSTA